MSTMISITDRLLPGKSRAEIVAGVTAAAGTQKTYRVAAPSPSTVMLTWRRTPTWAVVLALIGIFVFLLGLLFLLVKETDTITVNCSDVEGGVRVSAVGAGSPEMVEFLQAFLDPAD